MIKSYNMNREKMSTNTSRGIDFAKSDHKMDQCHNEEAKSYLGGLEENDRSVCKGKWGLK